MQHAMNMNPANKGALHKAMGLPAGRRISMGDLMATTKRKEKPKGGKAPMPQRKDSDSDYA